MQHGKPQENDMNSMVAVKGKIISKRCRGLSLGWVHKDFNIGRERRISALELVEATTSKAKGKGEGSEWFTPSTPCFAHEQ